MIGSWRASFAGVRLLSAAFVALLSQTAGAEPPADASSQPFRIPPSNAIRWVPMAIAEVSYVDGLATAQPIVQVGNPFQLPVRGSDQRLRLGAGLAVMIPLEAGATVTVGGGFDTLSYRRFKELNLRVLTAGGRLNWAAGERTQMSVAADLTRTWADRDEKRYFYAPHIGIGFVTGFDDEFGLRGGIDGWIYNFDANHPETESLDSADGTMSRFTIAPRYAPAGTGLLFEVALQAGERNAEGDFLAFDYRAVAPLAVYRFASGDRIELGGQYLIRTFHGTDFIDGVLRKDHVRSASIALLRPLLGPVFLYGRLSATDQDSRVQRQNFDSREITLGMTARF
jgi:hypothetical protein